MPLSVVYAILAAVLFGLSAPFSKMLLGEVPPLFLAALLYLGAGVGMFTVQLAKGGLERKTEARLDRKDSRYLILMVVLDIAAPVFLMYGIRLTSAATAALLGNFEIVATALTAMLFFGESVGRRLWVALGLITVASMILSFEGFRALSLAPGALLIILSSLCWGLENNCTRMLSLKDPAQIVVVKGLGSGLGALTLAFAAGQYTFKPLSIAAALLLGFFAYGLSIYCYVSAQRTLGAARTSAYYAFAPFIGVLLSLVILGETITSSFAFALLIMLAGVYFTISENHAHSHLHKHLLHDHRHSHDDGHHQHTHQSPVVGEHSHQHEHQELSHTHTHMPDLHHDHEHQS